MYEIKRIFHKRTVFFLLILFIANGVFFVSRQIKSEKFGEFMKDNTFYNSVIDELKEYKQEEAKEIADKRYQETKDDRFLSVGQKLEYLLNYPVKIQRIFKNADEVQAISIFQDANGFAYNNIIKTADDFEQVRGLAPSLDRDRSTEAVLDYTYIYYFVFIFMAYIVYELLAERENGIWHLTHTMWGGRMKMAVKRVGILLSLSFLTSLCFYGSTVLLSCILYGADHFGGAIQTLRQYENYPYALSKGMYHLWNFIRGGSAVGILTIFSYLLLVLFRNRNFAVIVLAAIFWCEWKVLDFISIFSKLNIFRYVNLISFLDFAEYDKTYMNVGRGKFVVSSSYLAMAGILILLLIASLFIIIFYSKMYPQTKEGFITKALNWILQFRQKCIYRLPAIVKEFYKSMVIKKGWILILLAIMAGMYFIQSSRVTFPELQQHMDELYDTRGGNDWEDFSLLIRELETSVEELEIRAAETEQMIITGELPASQRHMIRSLMEERETKRKILEELTAKREARNWVYDTYGINTYAVSDRGYNEIFGKNSVLRETMLMFILIIISVIIASSLFEIENESHMKDLLKASRNGIVWHYRRKLAVVFVVISVSYFLLYFLDVKYLLGYYQIPYLEAPLQSLSFMKDTGVPVTIFQYIAITAAQRYLLILAAVSCAILLSFYNKIMNQIYIPFVILIFGAVYWGSTTVSFGVRLYVYGTMLITLCVNIRVIYKKIKTVNQ